jgi:hypothetical protein
MRARSSLVYVVAFLATWALVLAPRMARAQTTPVLSGPSVSGIAGVVSRLEPNGSSADAAGAPDNHLPGVLVNAVNFQDCQDDLSYEFPLLISALNSGYNLNVWAGTGDCSQLTNRQAATAVCWPVQEPIQTNSNPYTVRVRMQDIVSQVFQTSHTVTYVQANSGVCQLQQETGATNISLYFFFADAEGNAVGNNQPYPITVDTRAGDVQGSISVGVGETLLIVNIPPTTDTDTQGWNVYCDPPRGKESVVATVPVDAATNNGVCVPDTGPPIVITTDDDGAVDAGDESGASVVDSAVPVVLDDAGGNSCGVPLNDAGIPSPGGCSSSTVLVSGGGGSGLTSEVDEAGNEIFVEAGDSIENEAGVAITGGNMRLMPPGYLCAQGGVSSTQINVLGLKNGDYYNVAVAATDAVGNVGPLSNVPCGEPVPVNDFWKVYYEAGGRAGGGFCSADGVGTPVGTGGIGALMVASMVAIVRRRRRK